MLIECKHCIFKFSREAYASHNCRRHYLLRAVESALFALTFIALAANGKVIHRLPIDQCSSNLILMRNLFEDFMVNHLLIFWAAAMWFNMYSVQKKQPMGRKVVRRQENLFEKLTDKLRAANEEYLLKFACCLLQMAAVAFK